MKTVTVLLVLGCVSLVVAEVAVQFSDYIVDKHNELRRKQKGKNMNMLEWNDTLAATADAWLQRCNFEHENKGFGENLAFTTGTDDQENMEEAFTNWYDEIKDYNYAGKSCQMSCHYTQLVWYKTRQVGCAIKKCPSLTTGFGSPVRNAWYFGCWYDPKGNWNDEYPYLPGAGCSECLEGQTCNDGLCEGIGKEVCEDKSENCVMWEASGSCDNNKVFMEKNCRQACGFCTGGKKRPCEDKDPNCSAYAFSCQTNKPFMKPYCPKTCGFC